MSVPAVWQRWFRWLGYPTSMRRGGGLKPRRTARLERLEDRTVPASLVLNEISYNPPSNDEPFEYVEIKGIPGATLTNVYLVVVEGDAGATGGAGVADFVVNVSGVVGTNGLIGIQAPAGGFTFPAATKTITDSQLANSTGGIENGSNTFLLVFSPTPLVEATDYDPNEDGVLDLPAGALILDGVAVTDDGANDKTYAPLLDLPTGIQPGALTRFLHDNRALQAEAWYFGNLSGANNTLIYNTTPNFLSTNAPANPLITPGDLNFNVPPTNTAPTSAPDSYTVAPNATLTVTAALGVLANDSDPDGVNSLLSAVPFGAPPSVPVTLNPDGSFSLTAPPTPTTITFQYLATDLNLFSSPTTVTITVGAAGNQAPIVTTTAGAVGYTENALPTPIDPGLAITDDGPTLGAARVRITNFVAGQDVLAFTGTLPTGVTANTSVPGEITFTGSATVTDYRDLLRTITYANSSENPDPTVRSVEFLVTDVGPLNGTGTRSITVTAVNDAPTFTGPTGPFNLTLGETFAFTGANALLAADVDAGTNPVQLSLVVTSGTLSFGTTTGITFTGGGNNSATPILTGTLANLNTALASLVFTAPGTTGPVTLIGVLTDQGNSGTGGPQVVNFGPVTFNVTAVALPTVSIANVTVTEGNSGTTTAAFTVTLSAISAQDVTVTVNTVNGSAVAGSDYTAVVNQLVTIVAGTTTATVNVTVNGDLLDEADETFTVSLSAPTNATVGTGTGTGTITDDDPAPSVSIGDVTVAEGTGGTSTATFTVTLSAASSKDVTLTVNTANGTATAGSDYTALVNQTVTILAGATTANVEVTVAGDTLDEPDETLTVTLSNPTNATLGTASATGTITDDDNPIAVPTLSIDNVTVIEGNSGTTAATFNVTLSSVSATDVTVTITTADGSATAGSDYTATSKSITIPAGTLSVPVTIDVLGDTVSEGAETFTVTLSAPVNATLATATGTGTITDDDGTPAVSIANVTVTEGNSGTTTAAFTVTLSAISAQDVTVTVNTVDGSATAGSDYAAVVNQLVTIVAGTTTATVNVTVNGDLLDEADETFTVSLSAPTNATVGTGTGTGTITDDDPTPSVSIGDVTVAEGTGGTSTATFTVTLSAASSKEVTLTANTANGTALAGADYTALVNQTVTIPAGQVSAFVIVSVVGDTAIEADETFMVTLSNPTNATLGTASATGTLVNDDVAVSPTLFAASTPPAGTVNQDYTSTPFTVTGNPAPTFSATGLPSGLFIDRFTGVISGTPTEAGAFNVTVTATNGFNPDAIGSLVLTVNPGTPTNSGTAPTITSAAPTTARVGVMMNFPVVATGDTPITFSATGLPAGLTINATTGVISGDPTAFGTFTGTITATNASGAATQNFTLAVARFFDPGFEIANVSGPPSSVSSSFTFDPTTSQTVAVAGKTSFTPFPGLGAGDIRSTTADVDGDGVADFIYATGPNVGSGDLLRVISGATGKDLLTAGTFSAYAGENFTTIGLFVVAADIDGDGKAEIVVSPDQGGGARIQIFKLANGALVQAANFFGIEDPAFRGGGRIALGDVNNDGFQDVIVGAGFGGGPRIAIFTGKGLTSFGSAGAPPKLLGDFIVFNPGAELLRNGTWVTAGDINGDGFADLVFGAGPGGGPRVTIFDGQTLVTLGSAAADAKPLANFFGGDVNQRGGIRVSLKDIDADRKLDLVVGSGEGFATSVTTYLAKNFPASGQGTPTVTQTLDPFGISALANGIYVG